MSVHDKNYRIWDLGSFVDQLDDWDITDSPLYYYEYSGAPAWFTTTEISTGKWLPIYTIAPPLSTSGTTTITVLKKEWWTGTLIDTITIDITVTPLDAAPWKIDHCSTASVVWLGPFGGWESYTFEGKEQTFQTGGKAQTFINSDNEKRYHDRGEVYQGVIQSTVNIPRAHIEHIANMHKGIQAFLWQQGNVFTPILIKPNTFKKAKTREPYIRYDFEFTYAKSDVIQTQ